MESNLRRSHFPGWLGGTRLSNFPCLPSGKPQELLRQLTKNREFTTLGYSLTFAMLASGLRWPWYWQWAARRLRQLLGGVLTGACWWVGTCILQGGAISIYAGFSENKNTQDRRLALSISIIALCNYRQNLTPVGLPR